MVTRRRGKKYRKKSRKKMCKCTSKCKRGRRGKSCKCKKCKFCKQKGGAWYSGFTNLMGITKKEEERKFDDIAGESKDTESSSMTRPDSLDPEKKKDCDGCEKDCDNLKDPSKMTTKELGEWIQKNGVNAAQDAFNASMSKTQEAAMGIIGQAQNGLVQAAKTGAKAVNEVAETTAKAADNLPGAKTEEKEDSTEPDNKKDDDGFSTSSKDVAVVVGGRRRRRRRKSKKKKKSRRKSHRKSRKRRKSRRRRRRGGNHAAFE